MTPGRLAKAAWPLALLPPAASAHFVETGLGPFLDGVTHFLLSLEDLLPVIALALLAGLGGQLAALRATLVLPAAWLFGGFAGFVGFAAGDGRLEGAIAAVSALVLGALVAADRRWPGWLPPALAAGLGLLLGWLNGAAIARDGQDVLALAGIAAAAGVTVALLAALVLSLRPAWMRVAVRVAGSWIAAVGLLLLGWSLRG